MVDILNANGKAGYARKTGNKLQKDLGVKYSAANYETNINESYVIINDLNQKQTEDIIMSVDEKYFKIKEDATEKQDMLEKLEINFKKILELNIQQLTMKQISMKVMLL